MTAKVRLSGLTTLCESFNRKQEATNQSYEKVKENIRKKLFVNKKEFKRIKDWNSNIQSTRKKLAFEFVQDDDPLGSKMKIFEMNYGKLGKVGKYVRQVNKEFNDNLFS